MAASSAIDSKLTKIIGNQIARELKQRNKNTTDPDLFIYEVDEKNTRKFYFLVVGLDDDFKGGEYIFSFEIPKTFPDTPPVRLVFFTPNGVFRENEKICISIGEYHGGGPSVGRDGAITGWTKGLGIFGFARQVINCLVCWQGNKGLAYDGTQTTSRQKQAMAAASRKYNDKHHSNIMEMMNNHIANNPEHMAVKNLVALRGEVEDDNLAAAVKDVSLGAAEE